MTDSQNIKSQCNKVYYINVTIQSEGGLYVWVLNKMFTDGRECMRLRDKIETRLKSHFKKNTDCYISVRHKEAIDKNHLDVGYVSYTRPRGGYGSPRFGKIVMSDTLNSGKKKNWVSYLKNMAKNEWKEYINGNDEAIKIHQSEIPSVYVNVDGEHEYDYHIARLTKVDCIEENELRKFIKSITKSYWE